MDEGNEILDMYLNDKEPTGWNGSYGKLNSFIKSDEFTQSVNTPVDKSLGEIVMMIVKYWLTYSLSQTAVTNLFSLINNMFACPILPNSNYLINCFFNPSGNATFHGLCSECGAYIGIFDRKCKILTCSICNEEMNVKSSSYNE